MALCPNRNLKRPHPGGGTPGCRGVLVIRVNIGLEFKVRRIPRGNDGAKELLNHRTRTYGTRVAPETIIRKVEQRKYDVVCSECGWSLDKAIATLVEKTRSPNRSRRV